MLILPVAGSVVNFSIDAVFGGNDKMPTLRQQIAEVLKQRSLDVRELSHLFGVREKEVLDHLQHIARSKQDKRFKMEPASCLECGFVFKKRERLNTPGEYPLCKSESITPPRFQIIKEQHTG